MTPRDRRRYIDPATEHVDIYVTRHASRHDQWLIDIYAAYTTRPVATTHTAPSEHAAHAWASRRYRNIREIATVWQ